jgi:small glutamine-rich tetratricopeptide repeat-containing protein alpha
MSARAYSDAVESYEEAIKLDPTNPVYLSNLAAAYSSLEDYDSAKTAAEKAIDVDPTFVKAYSRLG